uniref:Uncharacterized protein n=1 Tax=Vitis vinifera TaxID=29760 RepID=F6GT93_VITVI
MEKGLWRLLLDG